MVVSYAVPTMARGASEHVGRHPPAGPDPPLPTCRRDGAVGDRELAPAEPGACHRGPQPREVVRGDEPPERLDAAVEQLGRRAVQLARPPVPVQATCAVQMEGEGAEVGRVCRQTVAPLHLSVLSRDVLVQLGLHQVGDGVELTDLLGGPAARLGAVRAQGPQHVALPVGQDRAEVCADRPAGHRREVAHEPVRTRVVHDERLPAAHGHRAEAPARGL